MASLPVTRASSLSAAMPVVTAGSFQVVKCRSGVVVRVVMVVPSVSGKAPDDPTSPSWPPGAFFSTGKQGSGRVAKRGSDLCCVWISDDAQHRREPIGIRLRIPYAAPGASAWRSERPLLRRPQAGPSSVHAARQGRAARGERSEPPHVLVAVIEAKPMAPFFNWPGPANLIASRTGSESPRV